MNEFEKIIDDIRTTMISEADPSEIWLKELDDRYRTAVADANDRLKGCDGLLNAGHRGEAIQQAEIVPNLLDLVGILDFPEHSNWSRYLKEYGFNEAPLLDSFVAEQLNTAYNEEADDDELMRRHRLLAIRRGPLRARLAIIRQLAVRQNGNPIWQEDIPDFEESRHRQISQEAKGIENSVEKIEKVSQQAQESWETAIETPSSDSCKEEHDQEITTAAKHAKAMQAASFKTIEAAVDSLALLEHEVRSDVWRRPPAETTVRKIIDLHTLLRVKKAKYCMEQIGQELIAAHSEWDTDAGRVLREKWKVQAKIAQISTDHPLWKHVEPALNWLQQQDEADDAEEKYQEAVADLEYALDNHLSRAEIEKRHYKLDNMDRDIPRSLEVRVDEQLEALEVAARRRSRLVFATSVTGIVLIGIGIGFSIFDRARNDAKKQYLSALSNYVQDGEIGKAETLLADLAEKDPAIFESIEIQELVQDLNDRKIAEKSRIDAFRSLVTMAQEEGQDWHMHGSALAKLNRAEAMALGNQEHDLVQSVRDEVNNIYALELREMESQRRIEFEELFAEFESLENQDRKNLDSISKLKTVIEIFQAKSFVPNDVRKNVESMLSRLSAIRSTEITEQKHLKEVDQLWASATNRLSFEAQIEAYAAQYLNKRPLASELQQLFKDESAIWDGLEQRNVFARKWAGLAYQNFTPQQVQEYMDDGRTLFDQYSDLPGMLQAKEYVNALVPIANRYESDGRPRFTILRDLIYENSNLNVAIVRDEKGGVYRHFFNGEERPKPSVDGRRLKVYAYIDDRFSDTEQVLFQPELRILTDPEESSYLSPMSRFMGQVEANLNQEMPWEQRFYRLLYSLESQVNMEPIRKVRLLAEILEIGCRGSKPFNAVYSQDLQLISNSRLNYRSSQWVDSNKEEIRGDRRGAVNLLHNLGFRTLESKLANSPIAESKVPTRKLEMLNTEIEKLAPVEFGSTFTWCSCLLNDERLGWRLANKLESSMGDTDLFTFYGADGGITFSKIGTFVGGKIQIEQNAGPALKNGRPVFAQKAL